MYAKTTSERQPKNASKRPIQQTNTPPKQKSPFNEEPWPIRKRGRILNDHQMFLYRRVIFGLKVFSEREVERMKPEEIAKIFEKRRRARQLINTWKQKLVTEITNRLFLKYFPDNELTVTLVEDMYDIYPKEPMEIKLWELGITREQLINRFIEQGILTDTFWEITEPRFKKPILPRLKPKIEVNLHKA